MSTYVYMRWLEAAPYRYDRGIGLLSGGRVRALYAATAAATVDAPGRRVLEDGCGTGNLTAALVERGAVVVAVDQNPDMLAIAKDKLSGAARPVAFHEMAAVEIADRFASESFDAVTASLVLSEMGVDERAYVLRAAHRVLRPGGRLVIADEVRPQGWGNRVLQALLRWPLAIATYVLTQATTHPLPDLPAAVAAAGFRVVQDARRARGSLTVLVAERVERAEVAA